MSGTPSRSRVSRRWKRLTHRCWRSLWSMKYVKRRQNSPFFMQGAKKEKKRFRFSTVTKFWRMYPMTQSARKVVSARQPMQTWLNEVGRSIQGQSSGSIQNIAFWPLSMPMAPPSPAGAHVQHFWPSFVRMTRFVSVACSHLQDRLRVQRPGVLGQKGESPSTAMPAVDALFSHAQHFVPSPVMSVFLAHSIAGSRDVGQLQGSGVQMPMSVVQIVG
mmetsp:Transcript_6908/g.21582  ORF Transcript_6908/g.21582 Transcript_6908/m.21582 type:complete len:217 (-) Transcript_6908:224-874(-)